MILRNRRPPLILILVALLLILLPLLAYKQYDWLGKVSESEREQMQANMRRAADQFRDGFDREITRISDSFQISVDSGVTSGPAWRQLRQKAATLYANWMSTAPNARLVSDIFLVHNDSPEPFPIERLDPATGTFTEVPWPQEFSHFRKSSIVTFFRTGRSLQQRFLAPTPIDPSIPAIVVPVMESQRIGIGSIEIPMPRSIAQAVVKLNLDFIQKEFIPALARHTLGTPDGELEYHVAVIDRSGSGRVIYSSGEPSDVNAKGDVSTDILEPRPMEFHGAALTSSDLFEKRTVGGIVQIQVQKNQAAAMPFMAKSTFDEASPSWQLVLTHRAGSLDAAVAQTRKRNLAISFSILLILATSVSLIMLSAQRERRLARQQLEFVSAVSHELRTPLAVICSAGENLADGVVNDEAQTRQYGALVRNEGRRLAEMVEQVLDFAGIQSGRKLYRMEPADISGIVDQALAMFAMQIREAGVLLEKRIAADLPPVAADKPALIRAIQNLISNALKYGQAGKWIGVSATATASGVRLVVEDRGEGISSADLPHIFEPFYRGRSVVDAQIKGSGLGLSLVRQIVDAHQAKIAVESSSRGSSFAIDFPAMEAESGFATHDQAYSPR